MAKEREGIILSMDGVSMLDAGGLAALTKFWMPATSKRQGHHCRFAVSAIENLGAGRDATRGRQTAVYLHVG